jgi:hypothetical protein
VSSIELQIYLRDLAADAVEQLRGVAPESQQDMLINKMALLQTYLTSTGYSDQDAFALCRQFQSLVGELLGTNGALELQRQSA